MPKVILKFNLPEEKDEAQLAQKAGVLYSILWDFDQWLRTQIKHLNHEEYQSIRDKLYEIMSENNFSFDEVS